MLDMFNSYPIKGRGLKADNMGFGQEGRPCGCYGRCVGNCGCFTVRQRFFRTYRTSGCLGRQKRFQQPTYTPDLHDRQLSERSRAAMVCCPLRFQTMRTWLVSPMAQCCSHSCVRMEARCLKLTTEKTELILLTRRHIALEIVCDSISKTMKVVN